MLLRKAFWTHLRKTQTRLFLRAYSGPQKSWPLLPCISYESKGHDFCGPLYIYVFQLKLATAASVENDRPVLPVEDTGKGRGWREADVNCFCWPKYTYKYMCILVVLVYGRIADHGKCSFEGPRTGRLTHYRPVMPLGNRQIYFRGSF